MSASALHVTARVLGALPGSYLLSACSMGLLSRLLVLGGLPRSEAVVATAMLGFLVFLGLLLWAFSVRRLRRLWATLLLSSAACLGLLACLP
ncbi:MAG: iron transporter [Curvibacter sp.]|nr:MAG: iron transporter [Curvibacter sp.]